MTTGEAAVRTRAADDEEETEPDGDEPEAESGGVAYTHC